MYFIKKYAKNIYIHAFMLKLLDDIIIVVKYYNSEKPLKPYKRVFA